LRGGKKGRQRPNALHFLIWELVRPGKKGTNHIEKKIEGDTGSEEVLYTIL